MEAERPSAKASDHPVVGVTAPTTPDLLRMAATIGVAGEGGPPRGVVVGGGGCGAATPRGEPGDACDESGVPARSSGHFLEGSPGSCHTCVHAVASHLLNLSMCSGHGCQLATTLIRGSASGVTETYALSCLCCGTPLPEYDGAEWRLPRWPAGASAAEMGGKSGVDGRAIGRCCLPVGGGGGGGGYLQTC